MEILVSVLIGYVVGLASGWVFRGRLDRRTNGGNGELGGAGATDYDGSGAQCSIERAQRTIAGLSKSIKETTTLAEQMEDLLHRVRDNNLNNNHSGNDDEQGEVK